MMRALLILLVSAQLAVAAGCGGGGWVRDEQPRRPNRPGQEQLDEAEDYVQLGLDDDALAAFGKALEVNPRLIEAHMGMGKIYLNRENFPQAQRAYESAVAIDANSFDAHYYLGLTRQMMGRIEEAIRTYLRAASIKPDDFDVNLNLCSAYLMQGKPAKALPYVERAVEIDPESPGALANLAAVYSLLERWEDAVRAYRDAMELGEVPDVVVLGLAEAHIRLGNYQRAVNTLEAQTRRSPSAGTYERLGYAQFKLQQFGSALGSYQSALAIEENDTAALNGLGVCLMTIYIQSGAQEREQKQQAINAWRKSIQLRPDQPQIVEILARYEKIFDPNTKEDKPWYRR